MSFGGLVNSIMISFVVTSPVFVIIPAIFKLVFKENNLLFRVTLWSIVLFLFAFALKIKRMILNGRSVWETKFFTPRNKKSQLMVEKLIVTFSLFPVTLVKLVRSVKSALLLHRMRKNNHLIIAAGELYSAWIM